MTREELIISFYEDDKIPLWIKIIEYIKEKKNEFRNNSRMDKNRNNTIFNNSNSNTRTNGNNEIFNNA